MEPSVTRQLELIRRNTVEIIPEAELGARIERAIATATPLRVKLGLDPNRPDIHLGHTVVLQKLRDFQDLGHRAILIVGDFTGLIGDPSGRDTERAAVDWQTIKRNAETYFAQAARVIDYERAEVRYNSEWLAPLGFREVLELARSFTVHRMLERDDFAKRYRAGTPISIMEFLYPLAQAYDSVAIEADIELGGTDQRFNLMVGRTIQERSGQAPQCLVLMPLLEGTDGVRKMSKSLDNVVGVTEPPEEMFGKVMRMPDELIGKWRELVTLWTHAARQELDTALAAGRQHPMQAKKALARDIVARFHSDDAAAAAEAHFVRVFSERRLPDVESLAEFTVPDTLRAEGGGVRVIDIMAAAGMVKTKGEARRLIQGGGVYWQAAGASEERVADERAELAPPVDGILRAGKRRIVRLRPAG